MQYSGGNIVAELNTETGLLEIYNQGDGDYSMSTLWQPYTAGDTYTKAPWIADGYREAIKKVIIYGKGTHTINGTSHTVNYAIRNIGPNAFNGCTNLQEVDIQTILHLTAYDDDSDSKIGSAAFQGCSALKTVTFAEGCKLEEIASSAFYECSALEAINIPASVKTIGTNAFPRCTSLKTVDFSKLTALTTIGNYAFAECAALTTVNLANCAALTTIGTGAFNKCYAVRYVSLPSTIVNGAVDGSSQAVGSSAFVGCTGTLDLSEATLDDVSKIPFINTYFARSSGNVLGNGSFDGSMFVYLPKSYTGEKKPSGESTDNEFNIAYWDSSKWVCPRFQFTYPSSSAGANKTDQIYLAYDVTAQGIYNTSTRSLEADQFYTTCLPYDPTKSVSTDNATYYQLTAVSGTTLTFSEVAAPQANQPYLMKVTTAASIGSLSTEVDLKATPADLSVTAGSYRMVGTLGQFSAAQTVGKYILQADNKWQKTDTENASVYIPALRAYIEATGGASPAPRLGMSFGDDNSGTTAIRQLRTIDTDGTTRYYDLSGRPVTPARPGLYIRDGKKVVIK